MKIKNIAAGLAKVGTKAAQVASGTGNKAAKAASSGLQKATEKAKQAHHEMRMARLNPLFPEEYEDPDFDLPNMIAIVDEDQRKNIPECQGAIGWIDDSTELEVLNLYLETVPSSGLSFYPPATIGTVYYRDTFNQKHFIDVTIFSSVVQKDKMTELRNIAYALGATECRLESHERKRSLSTKTKKGSAKSKLPAKGATLKANVSGEASEKKESSEQGTVQFVQTFKGGREPMAPELRWFEHDKELVSLVSMVLSSDSLTEYTIKLNSSAFCSMSLQLASKIDASLKKLGVSGNFSMRGEVSTEAEQALEFYIKF